MRGSTMALMLLVCALVPVLVRVALIPVMGVPEPANSDEFTHLLNAEIYARGRLAEPAHPMSQYLETVYVLQRPAYAGKYPPGQGIVLAAGLLLGHPWVGVLISGALAGAALFWFLSALLPWRWAVAGSLLCGLRWLTFSYFLNSYFGGPLTMCGALLAAGALIRWGEGGTRGLSLAAGIGWSCIWLVRPFESLAAAAVAGAAMAMVKALRFRWGSLQAGVLWPGALMVLATTGVTCLHNYRVTGNPLMLPYQQAQRQYGVPQNPLILPEVKDPGLRQPNLEAVYRWQADARRAMLTWPRGAALAIQKPWYVLIFFLGPVLLFAMVTIWRQGWMRRRRDAVILAGCLLAPSVTYVFAAPHYLAAMAPFGAFLVADTLRRFSRAPLGWRTVLGVRRWVITLALGLASLADLSVFGMRSHSAADLEAYRLRREALASVSATAGRHLVLVVYGKEHSHGQEWVRNEAAVDSSRVVWALMPERGRLPALLAYFKDRTAWVVEADARPVRLRRFEGATEGERVSGGE